MVLAHGAGAGQHHPFMTATASQLAARGIDVVTFDFHYIHAGRKVPDRAPALESCFGGVIDWATTRSEFSGHRLLAGGKSMDGRMATHLAAAGFVARGGTGSALAGTIALGYPLHPPGKPQQLRSAHLPSIRTPLLIVQGSRDTFGTPPELEPVLAKISPAPQLHVVSNGDHSFKLRRKDPTRQAGVYANIQQDIVAWIHRVVTASAP